MVVRSHLSSQISVLDNYTLSLILELLDAHDLFHLHLIGNSLFNRRLSSLITRFDIEYDRNYLMKWPQFCSTLSSLSYLRIALKHSNPTNHYVIRDICLSQLSKSLKHLTLASPNALSPFFRKVESDGVTSMQMLNLEDFLPCIETLILSSGLITAFPHDFKLDPSKLPSSLTHLEFLGKFVPLLSSTISLLPPRLSHLLNIGLTESSKEPVRWPSSLTSLQLWLAEDAWIVQLPQNLTRLIVEFSPQFQDFTLDRFFFPPTLEDLEFRAWPLPLPDSLRSALPSSLTRLVWPVLSSPALIAELPPKLRSVHLAWSELFADPNASPLALPPSVTKAIGLETAFIPCTPSSAIPLWVDGMHLNIIAAYKRAAQNYDPQEILAGAAGRLLRLHCSVDSAYGPPFKTPLPNLVSLSFGSLQNALTLERDWMPFCPSLTDLELHASIDVNILLEAPFQLKTLSLSIETSKMLSFDRFIHDKAEIAWNSSRATSSLEKLTMYVFFDHDRALNYHQSTSAKVMPRTPDTTIDPPSPPPCTQVETVLGRFLSKLPQNLIRLTLRRLQPSVSTLSDDEELIPSSVFGLLPRSLEWIELSPVAVYAPLFNPHDISALPRAATELFLDAQLRDIATFEKAYRASTIRELPLPKHFDGSIFLIPPSQLGATLPRHLEVLSLPENAIPHPTLLQLQLTHPFLRVFHTVGWKSSAGRHAVREELDDDILLQSILV